MSAERVSQVPHPDGLILTVEELSSTVLLGMEGDIDLATIHHVMAGVNSVDLDHITLLVLDLDRVGFLTSRASTQFSGSTRSAQTAACISRSSPPGALRTASSP